MTASPPPWADAESSAALPLLRAVGEGPHTEYMVSFPTNAHELGKEVAAFATSGGGRILLGVTDQGELAGLDDLQSSGQRDALLRRLEGVCHGMVKPSVTPTTWFAVEQERVVLVIEVPPGSEPIYYCSRIPYVRHLTQSRPAEPHEVVELVRRWLSGQSEADPLAFSIATAWSDINLYADDLDDWYVNPHFEQMRAQLGGAASALRTAAVTDRAVSLGLEATLRAVAEETDKAVNWAPALGAESWNEFKTFVAAARAGVEPLYERFVVSNPSSIAAVDAARARIRESARRAADLAKRLPGTLLHGRYDTLLTELSLEGFSIFIAVSQLGGNVDSEVRQRIQRAAIELHKLPTIRFYPADPNSYAPLLKSASDNAAAVEQLLEGLAAV